MIFNIQILDLDKGQQGNKKFDKKRENLNNFMLNR